MKSLTAMTVNMNGEKLMSIKQPKVFIEIDDDEQEMWNGELNALRESGTMNMFGAVGYLVDNYGLERSDASRIFTEWTKTYS